MKHAVKHDLDAALAKKATEKAIESYTERFAKYQPQVNWSSDTEADLRFKVKGFSIKGAIELRPHAIEIDMDVPFALRLFKKQAIQVVEDSIRKWVDRARAGEL